jgi:hypothetical protein
MSAPSAYAFEAAMSALQSAQKRLAEDGLHDEDEIDFLQAEADVTTLLHRAVRTALHAESMAKAATARIEAIEGRQARYKRRSEAMRGAVFAAMDALGMAKLEMPDATVSKTAGRMTALITDEAAIPEEYRKTVVSIDKAKINSDVKHGVIIPGVEMSNGPGTLTIRTL